jgi:hypothetical protein
MLYIAPPQYLGCGAKCFYNRQAPDSVPDGRAIVQIDPREMQEVELNALQERDRRRYGSTLLVFYERPGV